jgi:hypothetical protein
MLTVRAATEENQPATHNLDKQNPRSGVGAPVLRRMPWGSLRVGHAPQHLQLPVECCSNSVTFIIP